MLCYNSDFAVGLHNAFTTVYMLTTMIHQMMYSINYQTDLTMIYELDVIQQTDIASNLGHQDLTSPF